MKLRTKNNLLLLLLLISSVTLQAQRIDTLFLKMPDTMNPLFSPANRMEMIEYYRAGQRDSVNNKLGGKSYIQEFDSIHNFIRIRNTSNSETQIKLLHSKEGKPCIGIIYTVFQPVVSSVISFYDTGWHRLHAKLKLPVSSDWLDDAKLAQTAEDKEWVRKLLANNNFVELDFTDTGAVKAENHATDAMTDEDKKLISPLLTKQPITISTDPVTTNE